MKKHVLFIQGGGDDGYKADAKIVYSLGASLGSDYRVHYPQLRSDESRSDFGWPQQIGEAMNAIKGSIILAGHSLGASLILKYLSETNDPKEISGIFLLAAPFWSGDEDWKKGLKLADDFADHVPKDIPIFFYHCIDDEEVPISHLSQYSQKLDYATFHEFRKGGHLFDDNLSYIADDIRKL